MRRIPSVPQRPPLASWPRLAPGRALRRIARGVLRGARRGALLAGLLAAPAAAQSAPRAGLPWRTVTTRHFVFHYPAELEAWTLHVAARIDSVYGSVRRFVGYAPGERVTVLVDDPYDLSNGSAWPLLDAPTIVLWPTPPDPSGGIGNNRGWGEMVSVHEFAHIAHLTRPSRNPRWRRLWSLAPARVSPVAARSPRWLIEGYATYVEGRLTGSGRPHGVVRPAVLRQWALEGKLPTYGQLSSTQGYQGGSMAYLVGSAYLEWLVARSGDSSLVHLWRRMSARRGRDFGEAFAGVFGGMPWDLYGRFTAEVTAEAIAAERSLRAAGLATGDTVQRLEWGTGAPALSPDDSLVAVQLRYRDRPSRIVVWRTGPDTAAERRAREERRRLLARDPEDVPAIEWRPPPRAAVATLLPVAGRAHESPRFFADGARILVTRLEPLGDGAWRPDLFVWDWRHGTLRRVTHGAAVRDGDPSPDGRAAVAQRCRGGVCDVVLVELATGAVRTLLAGSLDGPYYRPRWSPDGRMVVASRQMGGRWRLVVAEVDDPASVRVVDPDDGASRYDAAFTMGGRALVTVSEASGVANLEMLDLSSGAARPLTRVTGAALAPAPTRDGSAVYYLSLHARGLDVNRITLLEAPSSLAPLDADFGPVAREPAAAPPDSFPAGRVSSPRPYGVGPRRYRVYPAGAYGAEGGYGQLILGSTDPVGRLTWLAQGAYGGRGTWRGAGLGAAWRGWRPTITGDLFYAEQRPSRQDESPLPGGVLDADYAGALLAVGLDHDWGSRRLGYRAGASLGRLGGPAFDGVERGLAFAELAGGIAARRERDVLALSLALHGAVGSTGGDGWWRGIGTATARARMFGLSLRGDATYGETSRDAPAYERLIAGGAPSPLFDGALLSQRVSQPALPLGVAGGRRLAALRASTRLLGVEPYIWTVSGGDRLERWHRVIGAEVGGAIETLPLVHLPNTELLLGVGYSLDEPARHETRGYLSLRFRP
ncbi:MAG TPA: hypothetical protein VFS05_05270 [Gemmatimonadaceae bacterium]|nr:hypothetical protein [Gemmatimonadaceae bacterium]